LPPAGNLKAPESADYKTGDPCRELLKSAALPCSYKVYAMHEMSLLETHYRSSKMTTGSNPLLNLKKTRN
jgi:hypothetical protein